MDIILGYKNIILTCIILLLLFAWCICILVHSGDMPSRKIFEAFWAYFCIDATFKVCIGQIILDVGL